MNEYHSENCPNEGVYSRMELFLIRLMILNLRCSLNMLNEHTFSAHHSAVPVSNHAYKRARTNSDPSSTEEEIVMTLRLSYELRDRVDRWRGQHPDALSRSEALRLLVVKGLKADQQ